MGGGPCMGFLLLLQPCCTGHSVLCFCWYTGPGSVCVCVCVCVCVWRLPGSSPQGVLEPSRWSLSPLSLPGSLFYSRGQDGTKDHEPQTWPAHLNPTLGSGPASDLGQGRASWVFCLFHYGPNGSFVSSTMPWTPDCFSLFSLSTEHPLAGSSAGFQK